MMNSASFWSDRPVLVTGATGLIGGCLVRQLLSLQADVVCLVRDWVPQSELVRTGLIEQVKVVRGDVRELALLQRTVGEYEIDTVMHLAAQAIVKTANADPAGTLDTNVRGTWNLLEACRLSRMVKQIVLASTDKVYGDSRELPYHEGLSLAAHYPHDVSKACADMVAQCYSATYGLRTGMVRLPNIYGGGDLNWNRIIPGTIRSILRGQRPVISSNGKFIRDYLYVEDASAAHMLLAERLAANQDLSGQAFNISNETRLTVLELVDRILGLMGSDLTPDVQDMARHEILNQYLSAAKAQDLLGWRPLYTLEEGLERTIAWYRDYFASPAGKEA